MFGSRAQGTIFENRLKAGQVNHSWAAIAGRSLHRLLYFGEARLRYHWTNCWARGSLSNMEFCEAHWPCTISQHFYVFSVFFMLCLFVTQFFFACQPLSIVDSTRHPESAAPASSSSVSGDCKCHPAWTLQECGQPDLIVDTKGAADMLSIFHS